MATRKVILTGIGEWAKVFEENRDLEGLKVHTRSAMVLVLST